MSEQEARKFLDDVFGRSKEVSKKLKTDLDDDSFVELISDGKFTAGELRKALKDKLEAKENIPLVRFSFSESPCR